MWNALARLVVHLTAPGVPDVYRGDELWFQALVDPDNRRPVDWDARANRLAEVQRAMDQSAEGDGIPRADVLQQWRDGIEDGRLKLYLTTRLLRLRRDDGAATFTAGGYRPVAAEGAHAERVVAFRRAEGAASRVVLVPRLTTVLGEGAPIGARWGDTRLMGMGGEGMGGWQCLLSGVRVPVRDGAIDVGGALEMLPVAVLAPTDAG
jgi:(1->4)-alpha-D-glucan 1-alpha-D-glucosylmutase